MTEPAQAIRLDIPRPAPEVVKGFQRLATTAIAPGLHSMDAHLRPEDLATFWSAINDNCRPLKLHGGPLQSAAS